MHKRKHKILFVYDGPDNDHFIHEKLIRADDVFDLDYLKGFDQSLERLNSGEFDVFLLDLRHLKGQGEDSLNELRKHMMTIPTVVLTVSKMSPLAYVLDNVCMQGRIWNEMGLSSKSDR
jgi:DNA-binding NtrC family response regulator